MKILLTMLIAALSLFQVTVKAQTCASDTGIANRYQILGEDLELGDELTLTVGGYTVNYVVNDFSKAAEQWPRYLATEINSVIPESIAKAGDINNNYLPVISDTENHVDIFVDNTPVSMLINGIDASLQFLSITPINHAAIPEHTGVIPFWLIDSTTYTNLLLTNTSDSVISIKVDPVSFDGNPFNGLIVPPGSIFNSSNNPISSWANLAPGTIGLVQFPVGSLNYGQALISWKAETCIDTPLRVSAMLGFGSNSSVSIMSNIIL